MKTRKIIDDGFDMVEEMKRLGYTYRSLGKKLGWHFAHVQKIATGKVVISEKKALFIKNTMIEPKL